MCLHTHLYTYIYMHILKTKQIKITVSSLQQIEHTQGDEHIMGSKDKEQQQQQKNKLIFTLKSSPVGRNHWVKFSALCYIEGRTTWSLLALNAYEKICHNSLCSGK